MKKLYFLLMLFMANGAIAQQAFTLKEAIDYAIENDKTLKNAQLNILDAKGQINEIRSIGMPKVNGTIDYQHFFDIPTQILPDFISPSIYGVLFQEGLLAPREIQFGEGQAVQFGQANTLNGAISANMLLFDGTYLVGLQSAKLYRDFVQLQIKQAEREVKNKVTDAYLNTLIFSFNVNTIESNIKNLTQLITETKELYKAGFAEQLDVDRLEYSLQSLNTQLDNLKRQEEQLKNVLKFTISYPIEKELTVSDDIDALLVGDFAIKDDEKLELSNRPELAVINKGLELNDMDVRQYQMAYYPSVAAFASYQYSFQWNNLDEVTDFPTSLAGLQINIPIFDGFEKRSKIQRAQVAKEIAINQKDDLIRAINLEVETARISYTNAFEQVENTKKSVDLAQRIYDTTKTKYKEGVGSSFELIQAEQELYASQNSYQQALYDYLKAKADLKKALGK